MARKQKKMYPVSVRLDEDVRDALNDIAAQEDRSLSYMVNQAACEFVEAWKAKIKRKK